MSDDEYYYDEYDELNDLLYDADAEPDLADDLAAHATYSPIWQDDPSEELRDYFSDWEYYSDDYFDDDPKLLDRDAKTTKSELKIAKQQPKRGRKRKLSDAKDETDQKRRETMALTACLRGTVWKGMSPEPTESFKLGIEKPVALELSKDIMRAAYNKERGFGKGRLKRDESWANDLSLADMGLTAEKGTSMHGEGAEASQAGDGEEEYDDQSVLGDEEEMVDDEIEEARSVRNGNNHIQVEPELAPLSATVIEGFSDGDTRPRKRRKAGETHNQSDKNALPTPDASLESEGEPDLNEVSESVPQKRRGRPSKASANSQQQDEKIQTQVRKRKLSVSDSNATASTASSRAKRVATEPTVEKTAAASRPSRTRKK